MARINTNVPALIAQTRLAKSTQQLNQALARLSSGLRINRGADDPAGLIASEALRSEKAGLGQAIDNSQRAANVIATAEGALNEVSALLVSIKDLVVQAANTGAMSREEILANQLQIDSAIASITRIANTTSFAGLKLLNGTLDYTVSGLSSTQISDVQVNSVRFGTQSNVPVTVDIISSAQTAQLAFNFASLTAATIEVAGNNGVEVFSFASGFTSTQVVAAINQAKDSTGVSAFASGGVIYLNSEDYGSRAFVSVEAISGTFPSTTGKRDIGVDVQAVVNGITAVGDGLKLSINSTFLSLEATLTAAFATQTATSSLLTITGGGANFQLGPQVDSQQQQSIGIKSVAATRLGNATTGFLTDMITGGTGSLSNGSPRTASEIIDASIREVAVMRGRLGAFEKNTLETNMNSLQIALENVTASESTIRDADFAEETATLTRSQILVNAGTSVLAVANTTPQSVLSLLG